MELPGDASRRRKKSRDGKDNPILLGLILSLVRRRKGVRYSTPDPDGAESNAVCLPAFSLGTVNRDEQSQRLA